LRGSRGTLDLPWFDFDPDEPGVGTVELVGLNGEGIRRTVRLSAASSPDDGNGLAATGVQGLPAPPVDARPPRARRGPAAEPRPDARTCHLKYRPLRPDPIGTARARRRPGCASPRRGPSRATAIQWAASRRPIRPTATNPRSTIAIVPANVPAVASMSRVRAHGPRVTAVQILTRCRLNVTWPRHGTKQLLEAVGRTRGTLRVLTGLRRAMWPERVGGSAVRAAVWGVGGGPKQPKQPRSHCSRRPLPVTPPGLVTDTSCCL
jgi:hypothetical protein